MIALQRRRWFRNKLVRPIYHDLITEAVARRRLMLAGFERDPILRRGWLGFEVTGPRKLSLDPKKEAEGDLLYAKAGVKTLTEITSETTGGSWKRKIKIRAREEAALRDADLKADPPPAAPPTDEPAADRPEDEAQNSE